MPVKYKGILKINFGFYMPKYIYIYIKGLLTECEVCTGKYLPEIHVFSTFLSSEFADTLCC